MGIGTCIIAKPWSRVTINNRDIKLQKKDISITQNENIEIFPDPGYYGLSSVNISSIVPTFVKTNSFDTLPTDNVVNGTIGLIQEEENVFEPFTPGIEANALLFDTSFNLLPILEQFASENKWIVISNSGQESKIYENNNIYIPPNSIFIFGLLGGLNVLVNKSNNYFNFSMSQNLPEDIIHIFNYDSVNPAIFLNNYVKLSSTITLGTFYIIDVNTFSITTESVDNYLQLNKWMKCSTNNVEDKISQVYEYNDSWKNISKDIILQEKSEIVNSLTPSRIEVTPDEGVDALSKVTVDLSSLELQSKTVNITQNGQTTITPDEGKIGLDKVIINASNITEWGSTLEEYIDGAHGEYIKTSLLVDYQNTYNSFKDLTTIPQFSSNGNRYKFIPNLPLPSNTKGLFRYWYDIIEVPDFLNLNEITDVSNFFADCYSLRDFKYSGDFNATNSIAGLFQQCTNLSGDISINAPNATSANFAFYLCKNINSITLTTAPLTIYGQIFLNATKLQSVYNLNLGETSEAQHQPFFCSNLTNITFADGSIINNSTSFSSCKKLTVDSILNILNILKDLTGSTSATLTLGATNLAKLTDEQKAIATNKNWVLA